MGKFELLSGRGGSRPRAVVVTVIAVVVAVALVGGSVIAAVVLTGRDAGTAHQAAAPSHVPTVAPSGTGTSSGRGLPSAPAAYPRAVELGEDLDGKEPADGFVHGAQSLRVDYLGDVLSTGPSGYLVGGSDPFPAGSRVLRLVVTVAAPATWAHLDVANRDVTGFDLSQSYFDSDPNRVAPATGLDQVTAVRASETVFDGDTAPSEVAASFAAAVTKNSSAVLPMGGRLRFAWDVFVRPESKTLNVIATAAGGQRWALIVKVPAPAVPDD